MDAPICQFVETYMAGHPLRLHMPGHKGMALLGFEPRDITEITGADVLYHPEGIIRRSERNAELLWGSQRTVYSAEGSSLSIRAMLYLLALHLGRPPRILAGRNAHKVFVTAAALLGAQVDWLCPESGGIVACRISPDAVKTRIGAYDALYITSPDYLGNMQDIAELSEICHKNGAFLLVDNAHGAYLRFLPQSLHPLDLGADMCCDSAHKTLPVVTGGGYLHIAKRAPLDFGENADRAMAVFASTSPSYLILQSLDAANPYLAGGFPAGLARAIPLWQEVRRELEQAGWPCMGDEPLKLTLQPKKMGYTGGELARVLEGQGIIPEFADPDYLVLMLSPAWGQEQAARVRDAVLAVPRRERVLENPPILPAPVQAMAPRDALFAPCETIPAAQSEGRIMAAPTVSCPPAIPIVSLGEIITEQAVQAMRYYGIDEVTVVSGGVNAKFKMQND